MVTSLGLRFDLLTCSDVSRNVFF